MRTLESELDRSRQELSKQSEEIELRDREIEQMSNEIEALRNGLAEAQELYRKENKKAEKFKTAVMLCNNKMVDLEKTTEAQKAKIRNLELKLESVQNEVLAEGSANRKTDVCSISVPHEARLSKKTLALDAKFKADESKIEKYETELAEKREKIVKLKSEQFKACQIIKTMIATRGATEKEVEKLREKIGELEGEIEELKGRGDEGSCRSLREKVSEMGLGVGKVPASDNEVRVNRRF